jgi:hypothetical protein
MQEGNICNRSFILGIFISAIMITVAFFFSHYIDNQGFNPTDDGVILAQSFRILNGEIPHRDFISLRPVFSGLLHTIHFLSPLPLVESGRIFTLFEYFIYSFIWAYLFCKSFLTGSGKYPGFSFFFLLLGTISFLLNIQLTTLMPWTTVDALFLSSLGIFSFDISVENKGNPLHSSLLQAASLIFLALAALSRQTFAIIFILMALTTITLNLTKGRYFSLLPVLIFGSSPLLLYFFIIQWTGSWSFFANQMIGRTELADAGITPYVNSLIHSRLQLVNVLFIAFIVLNAFKRYFFPGTKSNKKIFKYFEEKKLAWIFFIFLYLIISITKIFQVLNGKYDLYNIPFSIFWIYVFLAIGVFSLPKLSFRQILLLILLIVFSWCSSISLGFNTPALVLGTLFSSSIILLIYFAIETGLMKHLVFLNKPGPYVMVIFTCAIILVSIEGRSRNNYRDLPARDLNQNLGSLIPGFGSVKTNNVTYDYYKDLILLLKKIRDHQDHFVVIPNNAIIYPLLKSKNPFPLDWLQKDEFIGSEKQLIDQIDLVFRKERVYIILNKYEPKFLAYKLVPSGLDNKKLVCMDLIMKNCSEIPSDSKYFRIYSNREFHSK